MITKVLLFPFPRCSNTVIMKKEANRKLRTIPCGQRSKHFMWEGMTDNLYYLYISQDRRNQPLCHPSLKMCFVLLRHVCTGHAVRAQNLHDSGLAHGGSESRLRGPAPRYGARRLAFANRSRTRQSEKAPAVWRTAGALSWSYGGRRRICLPRRTSTVFKTAAISRSAILP